MNRINMLIKILILSIFIQSCENDNKNYDKTDNFDKLVHEKKELLEKLDFSELKVLTKVPKSIIGDVFSILSIKGNTEKWLEGNSQLIGFISYKDLKLSNFMGKSSIRLILSGVKTGSLGKKVPVVFIYTDYANVSFVPASGFETEPNRFIINYSDNNTDIKYLMK